MGRIIIKTVHGRQYRYERISTKRENGKVVTKDKYLGPVAPAKRGRRSKMADVPEQLREEARTKYSLGDTVPSIRQHLRDRGHQIGERALRNWLKTQETRSDITGMREFVAGAEGGTTRARKKGWDTRKRRGREERERAAGAQAIEREERTATEEVLQDQLKREAAEAARWQREAGEWQQRFRRK